MTAAVTAPAHGPDDLGGPAVPERYRALAARVRSTSGALLDVEAPTTGALLGRVPHCSPDDVAEAARRARVAQPAWAATPPRERARVLLRFHDLVLSRQSEILDILTAENGKARRHAFEEVADVAVVSRYYARRAPALLRPRHRAGLVPGLTRVTETLRPRGLVGVISPWNYPLTLGVSDSVPALAAGNAVLAKPDERTPFSALWAAALLEEAGLPPDLLQVVTGPGAELGDPVVDHSDYVMFTGSTRVGRGVAARAAARLVECSMELGGKNALLVLDDADPQVAAEGAVRACFSNGGQLCISAERVLVADAVHDAFVAAFVARTRALRLSADPGWDTEIGSLTSAAQLATVTRHVEDAVAHGATVRCGGRARPDIGPYFYEPTVLTGVTPSAECYGAETFGPVAAVYRVRDEDEAVAVANDSDYGLSFSVWTRDGARGRRVGDRLQAGTVTVNDGYAAAWGSVDAPMGGMKASGMGRRHGAGGLLKYTEPHVVAEQRLLPLAPAGALTAPRFAFAMTAALRVMRRLPGGR